MEGFRPPDIKLETIWRTVLVTDARNSSKAYFSEKADEALVRIERDRALFLQIAVAHDGEEVRDRGDGSMFAFCDPVEAVRAAMAMQAEIARLNRDLPPESLRLVHRMGVHTGEIKLATTRIALGGRETVRRKLSGDIVVTASRLEGICHPGEVCFSNDVYKAIRGRIDHEFRFLDSTMKGFDRPVRCWSSRLDREWARPLTAEEELGKQRRKDEARLRETWEAEQREKTRRRRALRVVAPVALLCVAAGVVQAVRPNQGLRQTVAEWLVGQDAATKNAGDTKRKSQIAVFEAPRRPEVRNDTLVVTNARKRRVEKRGPAEPSSEERTLLAVVRESVGTHLDAGDYANIKDDLQALGERIPHLDEIESCADRMSQWKSWVQERVNRDSDRGDHSKPISTVVQGLKSFTALSEDGVEGQAKDGREVTVRYSDLTGRLVDAITNTETDQREELDPDMVHAGRSLDRLRRLAGWR